MALLKRLLYGGDSLKMKPILRYFDESYYLREYPHVADHDLSPVEHYLMIGWKDRYDPGPEFSTKGYLDANPDIIGSKQNPLIHFLQHGMAEGRIGWEKNPSRT
ncbi:hypothetical protein [Methylobacterium goesingense]|uniref:Uncharacterized protein n=1 Tax=Methylobacterium goesingense TaxID=243690 RepID=A0ABV2LE63_9HYPH|nr:hypothetical protein [Methylobacterium goesingense]